jgi:hypothetical protein
VVSPQETRGTTPVEHDTFAIGLLGTVGFQSVPTDNPLVYVNSVGQIVPEPSSGDVADTCRHCGLLWCAADRLKKTVG